MGRGCSGSAHVDPITDPPKWWPRPQSCKCWSQHEKEKRMKPNPHCLHFCGLISVCHNAFLPCITFLYQAISWNINFLLVPLIYDFTLLRMFDSICKGRIKKHFICAIKWENGASSCGRAALLSQIYTLILSMELVPFFTSQEKICFTLIHSNLCTIPTHFLCFQPHPGGKFLWEINMGISS